jgi:hypothetical protein
MNGHAEGGFLVVMPVCVLVRVGQFNRTGPIPASLLANVPDVGVVMPVFTDADLAKEYIRNVPVPEPVAPCELKTENAVRKVLEAKKKEGATHVGIDISFFAGRSPSGSFYTVEEVLAVLS